jgi:hypothetical protein
MADERPEVFHVLSLDGGGAKGFYTLGVLKELEAKLGRKIHESFDLIFGTSTGAIIAALLALGYSVDEIKGLYQTHVVKIMARTFPWQKTAALEELSREVFAGKTFEDMKTDVGIGVEDIRLAVPSYGILQRLDAELRRTKWPPRPHPLLQRGARICSSTLRASL